MKIFLLIPFLIFSISCTKSSSTKDNSKTVLKALPYDSPIHFVYDSALIGTDTIAVFQGGKIQAKPFNANNKALSDLLRKNQEQSLIIAYKQALTQSSKGSHPKEKILIQVPFTEPKEGIKSIYKANQIEESPQLEVQFSAPDIPANSISIAGKVYTQDQLSKDSLPFAKNLKRVFNLKMKRIEGQVSRLTLIKEAKEKNIPLDQYIKDHVLKGNLEVSDEEARKYAIDNNIAEDTIDAKLLARLKNIVESQKYTQKMTEHCAKLLADKPVKVAFQNPKLQMASIPFPEAIPTKGEGEVRMTLLSNFLCSQCKEVEGLMNSIVSKNSSATKLAYLFNFKQENRRARMVAEAALCVSKLDTEKFWDFQSESHKEGFDGQETQINEIVKSLGLDYTAFRKCFLAREFKASVDEQLEVVKNLGYLQLPVILVNGQVFENPAIEELESIIQEQIASGSQLSSTSKSWWQWLKSLFS